MNFKTLFVLVLVFCIACESSVVENGKERNYVPPTPMEWTTSNGIKVIYYNDNELPLVRASLYIRGNIAKSENPLLLEAMGSLLKLGGTKKYSPKDLDLKLEKLSASLSSSWGSEYGEISFSSLAEDTEALFEIVGDMILNPSFDKRELELWKLKRIDSINRRMDSASSIARAKYKKKLFGDSNYGYVSNVYDVKKITRQDLFNEKEKFLVPNDVYLTIVGPISKKKIDRLVSTYLSGWSKGKENVSDVNSNYDFTPKSQQIYFMQKNELNQASVYIVSKGPKLNEKEHVKYAVMSDYLGTGKFSSVLLKDLRVNKGLVYSTYGGVFPGIPYGSSIIFIETSDDKLNNALLLTETIVNNLKTVEKVDDEALGEIKKAMLNAEIFKTASLDNLVDRKFIFDFWGFSNDYDKLYKKRVESFNKNDLVTLGKKYVNLEDSFMVIVASNKALKNLKKLIKDNETIFSKYNLNICDVSKNGLCEK